jgi:thiosulfate/3-mercaptopyruvate sulfurtransferase
MKAIQGEELKNRLDAGEDVVVVEVLPEEYYCSGHIPGAGHLPLDDLDRRAGLVIRDRLAPVIVYCASEGCPNSHTAAKRLTELGYEDVSVYVWRSRLEAGDSYESTRSKRGAVGRERTRS